ncbi:Enolase 1 [Morus notabilis]|uniref:phosphopyruvate hydratase n=1 Tax=Morus notabilis TaxID=981085 RepID=W9QFT1_9ROSA|nr:Enolase 1 [Morus notabilis]
MCHKLLVAEFPSLEIYDPFVYDDWLHFIKLTREIRRVVDQIDWTITKCIEAVKKAERAGWGLVIDRHFSCGTKDTSIADLCIGLAMLGEIEKEVDEEYMER